MKKKYNYPLKDFVVNMRHDYPWYISYIAIGIGYGFILAVIYVCILLYRRHGTGNILEDAELVLIWMSYNWLSVIYLILGWVICRRLYSIINLLIIIGDYILDVRRDTEEIIEISKEIKKGIHSIDEGIDRHFGD